MNGLLLRGEDEAIRREARARHVPFAASDELIGAFERTAIVQAGAPVPWELLAFGFRFLERWDAAAPLWRQDVLARDVGNAGERERTQALAVDLRVPLYACELVFVRRSPGGEALLHAWGEEAAGGGEPRLAFLRALCRAKPLFLALPRTWWAPNGGAA